MNCFVQMDNFLLEMQTETDSESDIVYITVYQNLTSFAKYFVKQMLLLSFC